MEYDQRLQGCLYEEILERNGEDSDGTRQRYAKVGKQTYHNQRVTYK